MKKLIAAVLLVAYSSAYAGVVTIDFEEFAPIPTFTPVGVGTYSVAPGFNMELAGPGGFLWSPTVGAGNESSLVQLIGQDSTSTTFSQQNGAAFDLISFDMLFIGGNYDADLLLHGERSDGSTVDLTVVAAGPAPPYEIWDTVLVSGQFNNLNSLTFTDYSRANQLDNIVLSIVPIPAAVYLFGSGLGLLGWFRLKQA